MMVFKYLNGVNSTVGYSGSLANSLSSKQTHRIGQIPECELNFPFVVSKVMDFQTVV